MKVNLTSIFKCIFFLVVQFGNISALRGVIISKLTQTPCTKLSSSPPLTTGAEVFSSSDVQTASVQEMIISMWIKPNTFYDGSTPFFSVYSSTLQKIVSLEFIYSSQQLFGILKGVNSPNFTISYQYWSFVRLLVNLSPSVGGVDSLLVQSYQSSTQSTGIFTQVSLAGSTLEFAKSDILFNFGFSSSLIPAEPSCSQIKYVTVQFNFDSDEWTNINKFLSNAQFEANLLMHYDFFYSLKNVNTLLSFGSENNRQVQTLRNNGNSVEILQQSELKINIGQLQTDGSIISFELKIPSSNDVFTFFRFDFGTEFIELRLENQIIYLRYYYMSSVYEVYLRTVVDDEWVQYVIILEKNIYSVVLIKATIFHGQMNYIIPSLFQVFYTPSISFYSNSTPGIQVDNIRLFRGALIKTTASCLILAEADDLQELCLICQPGYYLSYEQSQTCLSSIPIGKTTSRMPEVIDWDRINCPLNMMHSPLDQKCHCPFQTYEKNGVCEQCPSYCRGCSSPTFCHKFDLLRDLSTGGCLSNMFDDGFNCIDRSFSIPVSQNKYIIQMFDTIQTLESSDLVLSSSTPFFFTLKLEVLYNDYSKHQIAYFKSDGIIVLDAYVEYMTAVNQDYAICFYYLSVVMKCFRVLPMTKIVVGMWISPNKVTAQVYFKDIMQHQVLPLSSTIQNYSTDPKLCFGNCGNVAKKQLSYKIGNVTYHEYKSQIIFYEIKYFRKMKQPISFYQDTYQLIYEESQLKSHYLLSSIDPNGVVIDNKGNPYIKIDGNGWILNKIKGLYGLFKFTIPQDIQAISLQVFFKTVGYYSSQSWIAWRSSSNKIENDLSISLIGQNSRNEISFQIEFSSEIYIAKDCFIKLEEPTFLAFIIKQYEYLIYSLEIVSNFCRETIQFKNYVSKSFSNTIIVQSNDNPDIYMNNIRTFTGSEFYFDYTQSDPCFLYYGLSSMKCLKAKKGYAMHLGTAIPQPNCTTFNPKFNYNRYLGECQEISILQGCAKIDEIEYICLKCTDPNADPGNQCACKNGYYYDEDSFICEKCRDYCATCGDKLNCISCKSPKAGAPSCNCIEQSDYLTESYECEPCSPQCRKCELFPSNCLICDVDRIDEPMCGCNPKYFDLQKSTTQTCTEITCSTKCETCENDANECIQCSVNRSNPPACDCAENYFEENQVCKICPSYTYYERQSKKCLPCDYKCKSCYDSPTNCTECRPEHFLYQSQCLCSDLSEMIIGDSGNFECTSFMNVSLQTDFINENSCLVFTFEYEVEEINFSEISVDTFLFIYFNQISPSEFSIESPRMDGNQLILDIKFEETHAQLAGQVNFLETNIFQNKKLKKMLDTKYKIDQIPFSFSTIVLKKDTEVPLDTFKQKGEVVNQAIESNSLISSLKKVSFMSSIINTIQPSAIFLMVNVPLPPNLYQFLQVTGILIFKQVPEQFNQDLSEIKKDFFSNLGLRGPCLLTMPVAFIRFGVQSGLYLLMCFLTFILGSQHRIKYDWLYSIPISQRIFGCIESNLFLLISLSTLQISNLNDKEYYNRMSIYAAFYTFFAVGFIYFKILFINTKKMTDDQSNITSKLKYHRVSMRYLNFQFCKKFVMAILVVIIVDFPQFICYLFTYILFLSLVITVILRPYKGWFFNLIKIIGELGQLIIWTIYAFVFAPLGQEIQVTGEKIHEEDVSKFLLAGKICIICQLAFHAIYLFESLCLYVLLAVQIFTKFKNRNVVKISEPQNKLENKFNNKTEYGLYSHYNYKFNKMDTDYMTDQQFQFKPKYNIRFNNTKQLKKKKKLNVHLNLQI